jgi:citrate lyase beta subunit
MSTAPFDLMLITNAPATAAHAVASGVDLVFVDLEIKGKHERQPGRATVISGHTLDDVARVRAVVPRGRLLVRLNPWDAESPDEVEGAIAQGADLLMLPMFRGPEELEQLVRAVDGRCASVGLLETAEAAERAADVAAVAGLSRIHIGLNDLHLALRRRFMFELLIDGTVVRIAEALRARSLPFGIGGLARVGEGLVPAETLLVEHAALGSTGAILSRTFHRADSDDSLLTGGPTLAVEIGKLRAAFRARRALSAAALAGLRTEMAAQIRRVVESL